MAEEVSSVKKNNKGDMTEGSVAKKLIAFSVPLAIGILVQAIYNLADMSIVGHFIGAAGMSAVTMGGLVTNVVLGIINGLSNGGSIYLAQLFGAKKHDQLKYVIGTMVTGYGILALIVTGLVIGLARPILRAIRTPEEAFESAVVYLIIYIAGTIFVYIYNVLAASLRGIGKTMPSMMAVVVTAVLNILLDLLFVGPLKMGVMGAAIATIISQFISMVILIVYVRKTELFSFQPKLLKIDWAILKQAVKIGIPQALQFTLTSMSFLLIGGFVNQYGVNASAASGAVSKIWTFEILPSSAIQMGMTTLTAQNIVSGKLDRIKKGLFVALTIAIIYSGLFWGAGQLFPEAMLSVFTSDAGVIEVGTRYLQIFLLSGVSESIMFCFFGIIAGSGHTMFTFLCALISALFVRLSMVWIFDAFTSLGFIGIAWAYVIAPAVACVVAVVYVASGKWKKSGIKV